LEATEVLSKVHGVGHVHWVVLVSKNRLLLSTQNSIMGASMVGSLWIGGPKFQGVVIDSASGEFLNTS
jgi:hypothetical protein